MTKLCKRASVVAVLLLWLCTMLLPCYATTTEGRITVLLQDAEKTPLQNVGVNICQVAQWDGAEYHLAEGFEHSGLSLSGVLNFPNEATAKDIAAYVLQHDVPCQAVRAANGTADFQNVPLGIWLVYGNAEDAYVFNPYLVLLPYSAEGERHYTSTSAPKTEDNALRRQSIYVLKRWNDQSDRAGKRPAAVTVELLDGGRVVAAVELSEQNGWSHTFTGMPKDGVYTVRETPVTDYVAHYGGDAVEGFVITNTYEAEKLPQTGQLLWPIVLLSVAGVAFLLLGILELGAKRNETKK
ncbi:MAG: Cna B-type domain-containing protein [Ruminococcaceae bacterium]|nr:Cna B-type domain-containing protein [Oscillospiraceae bacterium]